MKYIRTFSGIIVDTEQQAKRLGMSVEEYESKFPYSYSTKADTIEELCDAYVMRNPENNIHHFCKYECWFELQTIAKEHKDLEIYSAIWTDKGLIYVAKMNEKGELELL